MKNLIKRSQSFLLVFGLAFAFFYFYQELKDIKFSELNITLSFPYLAISFAILVLVYFLDATGWWLINRCIGVRSRWFSATYSWITSSIVRYIPGVVWGYINRTAFLIERKADSRQIATSFIVESLMLALSSMLVGLLFLLNDDALNWLANLALEYVTEITTAIIVLLLIFTGVSLLLKSKLEQISAPISGKTLKEFAKVILFYLALWLVFAFAFSLFVYSLVGLTFEQIWLSGAAFSLSFSLVFILILFPGGLGLREVVLYFLLCFIMPNGIAAVVSLTSRIWLILGELFSVFLVVGIKRLFPTLASDG